MPRTLFCTVLLVQLLAPGLALGQMVGSDESRARRDCIDQARREGWEVRSVSGFRARQGIFTVYLQVDRSGQLSQLSCAWDGRARIDVSDDPWQADQRGGGRSADGEWQRGEGTGGWPRDQARSAVDACELALRDQVRAEARRQGEQGGEAYVEEQRTVSDRNGEDLIRGSGSYRFGRERYQPMSFECRVDQRTRRVIDARWDGRGRVVGSGSDDPNDGERRTLPRDDRDRDTQSGDRTIAQGARTRRLTCESSAREESTCEARIAGGVRLIRRDAGRCEEGRDWSWRPDGITVRNGCRALFEYEARR